MQALWPLCVVVGGGLTVVVGLGPFVVVGFGFSVVTGLKGDIVLKKLIEIGTAKCLKSRGHCKKVEFRHRHF